MKINDLRIGNYISFKNGNILQINEINDNINGKSIQYYLPIPLTEEWLIKFGIEKISVNEYSFCGFVLVKKSDFCFFLDTENGYGSIMLIEEIKHVHHLQNIYFVFSGKELKLPT